ncbi:MAG: right-handed parallel beta-helix repeat-containing protein [Candidatus Gracilibacteria bacterium]|nr:right-handed parallel beta-helix repeat-containing protein [Candidatus Gracilibacteria bacterium]
MEKFNLLLSEDDLDYFDEFTENSLVAGCSFNELVEWRRAKLLFNGEKYDVKVKIHAASLNHYTGQNKSYKIKLLDDKTINGYSKFKLIIFSDRSFHPLINYIFYDFLDLYGAEHKLVSFALNDSDYFSYYFLGNNFKEYAVINELSNSSYIGKARVLDCLFNFFIRLEGGGHQNFLNYEFGFNEVSGDFIDKAKVNYLIFLLNQAILDDDYERLISFFDYDYLIKYSALSSILQASHDLSGDNQAFVYKETDGKFYPIVGSEMVYVYRYNLVEAENNVELCAIGEEVMIGEEIDFFSTLNKNPAFRQDKYKKIFEILNNTELMNEIQRFLQSNYLAGFGSSLDIDTFSWEDYLLNSFSSLSFNLSLLREDLTSSHFMVYLSDNKENISLKINPISISELIIEDLILNFREPLEAGSFIDLTVKNGDRFRSERIFITEDTDKLDISDYLFENSSFLFLDDDLIPKINETEIVLENGIKPVKDISFRIYNSVANFELKENENIFVYRNEEDYKQSIDDFYNYQSTNPKYCKTKHYNDLSDFNWNLIHDPALLQEEYRHLWDQMKNIDDDFSHIEDILDNKKDVLLTLQNYIEPKTGKGGIILIKNILHDLAFSKIYMNVVQIGTNVQVEIIPISLVDDFFDKFIIHFNDSFLPGQKVFVKLKKDNGDVLLNYEYVFDGDADFMDISFLLKDVSFRSDFDENLKTVKTKYFLNLSFVDFEGNIFVDSLDLKAKNSITDKKLSGEDLFYEIADGNAYYFYEKDFSPRETYNRYGIFDIDEDKLILSGNVYIYEDIIVPKNTELIIDPGTNIYLAQGVSLVSYSKVTANGAEDAPINVYSIDPIIPFGTFSMLDEGASGSTFDYFNIQNGSETYINGVYFSGMFNAYHVSDVIVNHSSFKYAKADDSLNFKYSNSDVLNSYFFENSADAIDFDFMGGNIIGNRFENNGDDAVDTSGSTTLIKDNYIYESGDKCISLGEKSNVLVVNNLLDGCSIGIEVKDLSSPVILNNVIKNNAIGVNSYQKKSEFGGGHAEVWNTLFYNNGREIVFENTFKGKKLKTDDSDISINFSNIPGGFDGDGNVDLEADGLFLLKGGSLNAIMAPDYIGATTIGLLPASDLLSSIGSAEHLFNDSQILSDNIPLILHVNEEYPIFITVINVGELPWSYNGLYKLGFQMFHFDENVIEDRILLEQDVDVFPDDIYKFEYLIKAPSEPGLYKYKFQMVQESIEWFGDDLIKEIEVIK